MAIEVTFTLSDTDLEHFRKLMKAAHEKADKLSADDIRKTTEATIASMSAQDIPEFVTERVAKLKELVDMLDDEQWQLPEESRQEVLTSLSYFCEPDDLIPDHIPGLGYLDDAIMIELVVNDLADEIATYRQFCEFRKQQNISPSADVSNDTGVTSKRHELHSRLRERRNERRSRRVFSRIF
ncbi:YkvA family protein [Alteromonadaceae bacterium BrNp21-10]|nr:YkvA family protein [Alteromonadaceae bacterium BrNp21-10]